VGIDLTQVELGIAEAYRATPTKQQLQAAGESAAIFPAPLALATKKAKATNATAADVNVLAASYSLGIVMAANAQTQFKRLDVPAYMQGFKRGYAKAIASPKLAAATVVVIKYYQQQRMVGAEDQLIKSTEFLLENAKRKGVIVTNSGLQYEILAQGTGAIATWKDMVQVNYRDTKPNSEYVYDSAEDSGPTTYAMRGAMPEGWRELFALMNKGARYRVYLPPNLGWGKEGAGETVLPNEVLITEFTLLDIIPPPPVSE
jgi:FKBP-type peptidyl-prolyl cis-trans isomerase